MCMHVYVYHACTCICIKHLLYINWKTYMNLVSSVRNLHSPRNTSRESSDWHTCTDLPWTGGCRRVTWFDPVVLEGRWPGRERTATRLTQPPSNQPDEETYTITTLFIHCFIYMYHRVPHPWVVWLLFIYFYPAQIKFTLKWLRKKCLLATPNHAPQHTRGGGGQPRSMFYR